MTPTDALFREIKARAVGEKRFLVAVAGPPGSGKSTLAENLVARLGPSAAVVPMDGFHLDNDKLQKMGLLERKGAPETFDAEGFVSLIRTLRSKLDVTFPTFDRESDITIPCGGHIDKGTSIVVIEGSFLLLKTPTWSELAELFDLKVQLEVARKELEARLVKRWLDHGFPVAEARARALGNDMRNVDFVTNYSLAPDFSIRPEKLNSRDVGVVPGHDQHSRNESYPA